MENINLIYDYLDGNIESQLEEKFFLLLSSNEEMRLEFRQQLAIKEAIRSDSKAFLPKAESTNAIFSTLGFSPNNLLQKETISSNKTFFQKYVQGVVGGLLGAILTLVIVLLFIRNGSNENNNFSNFEEVKKLSNQVNIIDSNKNIDSQSRNINNSKQESKIVYKYIKVPNNAQGSNSSNNYKSIETSAYNDENSLNTNTNKQQESNELDNIKTSNELNFSNIYSNNSNSTFILPNRSLIYSPFITQLSYNKPNMFSLEIKGSQSWYTMDASINPKEYAPFNNSSLGIFYSLSENLLTGLELRQENFYQKYYVADSIGNLYLYEQQPNITSYNLGFRFKFTNFDSFYPIIQSSLGFTNAGIIGRLSGGIEYQPYSALSIIFGLEFSDLFYHHNNTIYGSPKFGIFYGSSIKF